MTAGFIADTETAGYTNFKAVTLGCILKKCFVDTRPEHL